MQLLVGKCRSEQIAEPQHSGFCFCSQMSSACVQNSAFVVMVNNDK